MPSTPIFGFSYPSTAYTDGFEDAMAVMAGGIDTYIGLASIPSFASDGARNTAIPSPATGQRVLVLGIIQRYNGSAWKAWESDWITYTPTLTNFVVGTGGAASSVSRYRYEQGRVHVDARYILGTSGASVSSDPTLTLPVSANPLTHAYQTYEGLNPYMADASATYLMRDGVIVAANTSTLSASLNLIGPADSSTVARTNITSTIPWTWAAGDVLMLRFVYDPA